MLRRLIPLFILLLPLAEIACFILVGRRIGLFPTLSLVVFSAIVGIVLMRVQGFGVLMRLRQAGQDGRAPGKEMLHAWACGAAHKVRSYSSSARILALI